jgi:hypothetical protein
MQKPTPWSHWRHYKSTGWDDHTYEILGIAVHSETEEPMVLYRPLYPVWPESWAFGYDYVTRPLSLWYDIVEYKGVEIVRFTEIEK